MDNLANQILIYKPYNYQEEKDKEVFLSFIKTNDNIYSRKNEIAHITASGWVLNKERNKILMAYHNIYHSWSWLGGHSDNEKDLLKVAIKEVQEESGLTAVKALSNDIFSIEILTVDGHIKNNKYVSSHIHLNITYLLEANSNLPLKIKPDENSDVAWFNFDEVVNKSNEKWMRDNIYAKLMNKVYDFIK